MLLDVIDKETSITQRRMSSLLHVSISMINEYLNKFEKDGYLIRNYKSAKVVEYLITPKGVTRKKLLNIWYLDASQQIYNYAKQNLLTYLKNLESSGIKKIVLYGAGEVAEIFLQVIRYEAVDLDVLGIIDDDLNKQGSTLLDVTIIDFYTGMKTNYDGILVSTYGYHEAIRTKLLNHGIPSSQILGFFS